MIRAVLIKRTSASSTFKTERYTTVSLMFNSQHKLKLFSETRQFSSIHLSSSENSERRTMKFLASLKFSAVKSFNKRLNKVSALSS